MVNDEELTALRAEVATLRTLLHAQAQRIAELEARLAKNSCNSSKPPSSDGFARKTHRRRFPSAKPSGGQTGHPGHTLEQVLAPDRVVTHRPAVCRSCQQDVSKAPGVVVERRQVHELPDVRVLVTEHQREEVTCPTCQARTRGAFPSEVRTPAQYGPIVRAAAVYLHAYHLLPLERTAETLTDLFGCPISDGTVAHWAQQAATVLVPTVKQIGDGVIASRRNHADETGVRIRGQRHWLHVNATRWLTHLAWHPQRGRTALDAIGIWPRLQGRVMHDRWASYDAYQACQHSVCGAHLLRELTYLAEVEHEGWAQAMHAWLVAVYDAAQEWRARGAARMPQAEREDWLAEYFAILARGFAAHPPPTSLSVKRRGRRKQSAAKNLLDALLMRAEQVLVFVDDLHAPFTNNQAERDLRMAKVQQKIAGTFRSEAGATAFCRIRSYLGTMRKQGRNLLAALVAVFNARPFSIAWAT